MAKTISSQQMRERMLARFKTAREALDWRTVLRSAAARDILSVIANGKLQSVSELAELTGRAQPNVSRSLASLSKAGLIELVREGRIVQPTLTKLGREKAGVLELVNRPASVNGPKADESQELLAVELAQDAAKGDEVPGSVVFHAHLRTGDLLNLVSGDSPSEVSVRWARDWWRMLYRRDALYRFLECRAPKRRLDAFVLIKSTGREIEMSLRGRAAAELQLDWEYHHVRLGSFANLVRRCVLNPVAQELRRTGRFDRSLHSLLARLDDADAHEQVAAFYKTAGALDLDAYNLTDSAASSIRSLMDEIPEEEPRLDFASAVLGPDLAPAAEWVRTELRKYSRQNRLEGLPELSEKCSSAPRGGSKKPWQIGVELAKELRSTVGLGPTSSVGGVEGLCALLGGPKRFAFSPQPPGALLAYQSSESGVPTVVSGDTQATAELFVLARSIGDYLHYKSPHAPVADIYTDRQALGRAFAAELLAPANAVASMIEEDGLLANQVARHFGTTTMLVNHQYENNSRHSSSRRNAVAA